MKASVGQYFRRWSIPPATTPHYLHAVALEITLVCLIFLAYLSLIYLMVAWVLLLVYLIFVTLTADIWTEKEGRNPQHGGKLRDEELHNLYCLQSIIKLGKSCCVRWAGCTQFQSENLSRPLGRLGARGVKANSSPTIHLWRRRGERTYNSC
jgi:hypothetical protein